MLALHAVNACKMSDLSLDLWSELCHQIASGLALGSKRHRDFLSYGPLSSLKAVCLSEHFILLRYLDTLGHVDVCIPPAAGIFPVNSDPSGITF